MPPAPVHRPLRPSWGYAAAVDGKREHLWIGILAAGAALAAFLLLLRDNQRDAEVRIAFEQAALERVHEVAAAQQAFHQKHGRYGWPEDLRRAGVLADGLLDEDGSLVSPRYRIDILLPYGLSPREFVQMAPHRAAKTNPRLEQRHFAVVARPWGAERTGHRAYYLDETGQVYISEGVSYLDGGLEPPLPELHLSQSGLQELGSRRWWPVEEAGKR